MMTSTALRAGLTLLLAVFVSHVVFVTATLALSRALGARVRAAAIGAIPVARFEIAQVKLTLGALPLMAWVEFPGRAPGDAEQGPGTWRRLSLPARLALTLGPWIVMLALAMLCLGGERAVISAGRAFTQLLVVPDLTPLVRGFAHLLATEPAWVVLGVVCAKVTAFNLLPVASLAGGAVLQEIASALRPSRAGDESPSTLWSIASTLFVLVWVVGRLAWGLAHAR